LSEKIDGIDVLVNAMHSGWSPDLGIWRYFEKIIHLGIYIHYVEIPMVMKIN